MQRKYVLTYLCNRNATVTVLDTHRELTKMNQFLLWRYLPEVKKFLKARFPRPAIINDSFCMIVGVGKRAFRTKAKHKIVFR